MKPDELIDRLGGVTAVARLLHIKPPSVHRWKEDGIPEWRLLRLAPILEARGIISRKALFPKDYAEIWPELARRK